MIKTGTVNEGSQKMKLIGTVLPTQKSLLASERYAAAMDKAKRHVAAILGIDKYTIEETTLETRYWKDAKTYAIIGRDDTVKWFEVRADGEYRI